MIRVDLCYMRKLPHLSTSPNHCDVLNKMPVTYLLMFCPLCTMSSICLLDFLGKGV